MSLCWTEILPEIFSELKIMQSMSNDQYAIIYKGLSFIASFNSLKNNWKYKFSRYYVGKFVTYVCITLYKISTKMK